MCASRLPESDTGVLPVRVVLLALTGVLCGLSGGGLDLLEKAVNCLPRLN